MTRFHTARAAPIVHPIEPSDVRAAGTLADPDYLDAFELSGPFDARSAEHWARAIFEDAPLAMRLFLLLGWRFVLGLRLGPRSSPDHVLGWKIIRASAETIVLGVDSNILGQAQLVVQVERTRVVLGTLISFERGRAHAIWFAIGLIHRRTLSYLLTRAWGRR
jgi:hypothetical protein